jgi:hypothetical protein
VITHDIKVAIGWGRWVDARGCHRRLLSSVKDSGCPLEWLDSAGAWHRGHGVGLAPYSQVATKPAPATLADCFRANAGRMRRRSWGAGHTIFADTCVKQLCASDLEADDWTYFEDGEWISPNGEVDAC